MDLFNKKLVKQLKEENEQLRRTIAPPQILRVYEGDCEQLVAQIRFEENVPAEIIKRRLAGQLANIIIERELIDYNVDYDPRTMTNCLTARVFVGKRR